LNAECALGVISEAQLALNALDTTCQISAFAKLKLTQCARPRNRAGLFVCSEPGNLASLAFVAWVTAAHGAPSLFRACIFRHPALEACVFGGSPVPRR
jgi:hypothetical protein